MQTAPLFKQLDENKNYSITSNGLLFSHLSNKFMKLCDNKNGYLFTNFKCESGKLKNFKIHRLVAKYFIENPNNYPCVDHIDKNKYNNNVENLRWCTQAQNSYNSSLQSNNTSGNCGVRFNKRQKKYEIYIKVNGTKIHLGVHTDKDIAIDIRIKAEKKYFGEFRSNINDKKTDSEIIDYSEEFENLYKEMNLD